MYIELFAAGKAYRGELISNIDNVITFSDIFDNSVVTLELPIEYDLYSYNDRTQQFDYKVEHIIASRDEGIFTEEDINLIANSYDVIRVYRTLHSLRSLGFKFNTLEEVTLQPLIEKLKIIIEREYVSNVEYIDTDDELTSSERKNLIDAIDRAKVNYYNILQVTDNIIEVLDTFPSMFNETLSYISEIIKYIKHDEEIADYIRAANAQAE